MFARYATAAIGACLLATSPALAQAEPLTATVNVADLDLATEAGMAQLNRRIRSAASRVCYEGTAGLTAANAYQVCYRDAVSNAGKDATQLAAKKTSRIRMARNTR